MWFDEAPIGKKIDLGTYTFTAEEIIAFAKKYDPQPFHVDPDAATHSMFGGLIASGWHTAAVWMKLMIANHELAGPAEDSARSGVSPGFESMRWLKPVRPGMTLRYSSEIIDKVELGSRPEWGLVKSLNEARDEQDELVMRFIGKVFVPRRTRGA